MPKPATARQTCFVIMPFTSAVSPRGKYNLAKADLDTVFDVLRSVLSRQGYQVSKANSKGDILADIVFELDRASLVCADLTGLNPNVMYELGIRHGFTKKTILLTQDLQEVPFDLRAYHCIEYAWVTSEDKRKLAKALQSTLKEIDKNPNTRFGPVHSHLGTKRLAVWEEEKRSLLSRLSGLNNELTFLWGQAIDCLAEAAYETPEAFTVATDRWEINPSAIGDRDSEAWKVLRGTLSPSYPAIDLLLSTHYLPSSLDHYGDVQAFLSALGTLRLSVHGTSNMLVSCLRYCSLVESLASDALKLRQAVQRDQIGEDLGLSCNRHPHFRSSSIQHVEGLPLSSTVMLRVVEADDARGAETG